MEIPIAITFHYPKKGELSGDFTTTDTSQILKILEVYNQQEVK